MSEKNFGFSPEDNNFVKEESIFPARTVDDPSFFKRTLKKAKSISGKAVLVGMLAHGASHEALAQKKGPTENGRAEAGVVNNSSKDEQDAVTATRPKTVTESNIPRKIRPRERSNDDISDNNNVENRTDSEAVREKRKYQMKLFLQVDTRYQAFFNREMPSYDFSFARSQGKEYGLNINFRVQPLNLPVPNYLHNNLKRIFGAVIKDVTDPLIAKIPGNRKRESVRNTRNDEVRLGESPTSLFCLSVATDMKDNHNSAQRVNADTYYFWVVDQKRPGGVHEYVLAAHGFDPEQNLTLEKQTSFSVNDRQALNARLSAFALSKQVRRQGVRNLAQKIINKQK